jgi:DNA-binding NtrC family response regulator
MKLNATVLIVDDDLDILTAGKLLLKRQFEHIVTCNEPSEIPKLMARFQFDAILLDMNFGPGESSGQQGFNWLEKILQIDPQAVVIMITAHGGVNVAVEAMKIGATDFVAKPWQNEKLIATLSSAVQLSQSRAETKQLKQANQTLSQVASGSLEQDILGQSNAMQQVQTMVKMTAPTDANVLILGENGTGKELIARAIHKHSLRADKVFMSVDLGAVSETLFESELFGHKKGAFTGANEDRVGRLQAANGGTLFLDEIGNLPMHLQAKMLTVLEQRQVTPLGSNQSISIDVRVIAATNANKESLADETKFRQDLLFRLNTVEILLPALRDRASDIPEIANYYLELYGKKYNKPALHISEGGINAISRYSWPGNIRALRHAIERAVILCQNSELTELDFQLDQVLANPSANKQLQNEAPVELNLEVVEKNTIAAALKKHKYNISHAAKELGLTRAALYRRMEKHGL